MRLTLLFSLIVITALITTPVKSQTNVIDEGFEGLDSLQLPSGWSVFNKRNFPITPFTNWTVRDTGRNIPGLTSATSKAHSGLNSIGASWWAGVDTNTSLSDTADAWLVTKRVNVTNNQFVMIFYVTGGSPSYKDSMQVWVSTVDSLPEHFNNYIYTKVLGPGPYGVFGQEVVDLGPFNGQTIWIGFRYYIDVSVDGYFVQIDDVTVINPIGIEPIGSNVPKIYALKQNYPNPFNPVTYIEFSIPKKSGVRIEIFDILGIKVATLVNETLNPGTYKVDWNGSNIASGIYFYKIIAADYINTKKMVLLK